MALTLTKLTSAVTHALGGTVASQLDVTEIVNEAGRLLCGMHPWRFLIRPPSTLDFTASTAYVALPADFGELVTLKYNANLLNLFEFGSALELADIRAATSFPPAVYRGHIVQPVQINVTSVPPVQRLELAPIPTATVSAALAIWYRARWTELSTGTDVPNLPIQANTLLTEIVRAVAKGWEEEDNGTTTERLGVIRGGAVFEILAGWDNSNQTDFGHIGPGAVAFSKVPGEFWEEIADPS